MFVDEATIHVIGGSGGRGCMSWRREKYVPKGGPDGGDGGNGGDVILRADGNTDTLSDYASNKKFQAHNGEHGQGKNKHGKRGDNTVLLVPPGTFIRNKDTGVHIADLAEQGDEVTVARGGRGGYGNAHFVSSVRQRPDFAELGEDGEDVTLSLELKLVADVALVGFPNAGKSTLISVITHAKPKIGDYPFTTIRPNLGVVKIEDRSYVVCDVPGLIEGASEGKGLGDTFLRHIERTGVIVHLLDLSAALKEENKVDIDLLVEQYHAIRHELENYSPALAQKKECVVLNKIDLLGGDVSSVERELQNRDVPVFFSISGATQFNTKELSQRLLPIILKAREERIYAEKQHDDELLVLTPQKTSDRMVDYTIADTPEEIRVTGKRVEQMTNMTDFLSHSAVQRFQNIIERIGLQSTLQRMLKEKDRPVFIGDTQVNAYLQEGVE